MNQFEERESERANRPGQQGEDGSLEAQLAGALARCEPPADFTSRVLTRVMELDSRPKLSWWKRAGIGFPVRSLRWVPALGAIALIAGGMVYREHERAVEGLRAKQQLLEALRITNAKLRETGVRVAQVETRFEQ